MHDPHLDLHQIKYKIRIGIKVISRIPIHMKVMRISNPAFWLVICILMGIRIRIQLITLIGIQILPVNVMLIRNTAFWLVTCILMQIRIQITLMWIRILPCNVMRIHATLLFFQSSEMKK